MRNISTCFVYLASLLIFAIGCSKSESSSEAEAAPKGPTREQAEASSKNIAKICIAVLNYEATEREFPLRAIPAKDGKPGLSWRVAVLPYLDQNDLYKQFKLDEPWDSPANKPLLAKMPAVYKSPVAKAEADHTNYVAVATPLGVFGEDGTTTHAGIRDGTDNTVMIVEADAAVPWTKPEDYVPDSANPLAGLGGLHPKGAFLLATVSGNLHFLQKSMDPAVFMALTTRRGMEIIDWDAIKVKAEDPSKSAIPAEKQ